MSTLFYIPNVNVIYIFFIKQAFVLLKNFHQTVGNKCVYSVSITSLCINQYLNRDDTHHLVTKSFNMFFSVLPCAPMHTRSTQCQTNIDATLITVHLFLQEQCQCACEEGHKGCNHAGTSARFG